VSRIKYSPYKESRLMEGSEHKRRKMEDSRMALDKVPVSGDRGAIV